MPEPRLEAEALETAALRGRPKSALGTGSQWREPFERLTEALRCEADLNPLGKAMAHGQLVMMLRARIRAESLWQRKPELLQRPLGPPVIILGQMRSGTTRLQRLLACDERFSHTRMFESLQPVPQPARRLRAAAGLFFLRRLNPLINRIHPTSTLAAEEEFGLFSFSFGSPQFEAQWRVPAFTRWWEQTDKAWQYREFAALLRTIEGCRRGTKGRPWILKAPQFLQDLPELLDRFPDASLLCLERDPSQIVASSASLVWNQMRIQSDHVDRSWIGQEWLGKTLLREKVKTRTLVDRPDVPRLIVDYEAMNRSWRRQIERIYEFLGLDLGSALLERMEFYLANAREHRGHHYTPSLFGLTDNALKSAFEPSAFEAQGPEYSA